MMIEIIRMAKVIIEMMIVKINFVKFIVYLSLVFPIRVFGTVSGAYIWRDYFLNFTTALESKYTRNIRKNSFEIPKAFDWLT